MIVIYAVLVWKGLIAALCDEDEILVDGSCIADQCKGKL
jgi:hypothetical protein